MAAHDSSPAHRTDVLNIVRVAAFPGLRTLAWRDDWLYASRGYSLLRVNTSKDAIEWQPAAPHGAVWWRNLSVASRLTFRLFRDGFHALASLASGHIVAAVPGAI